MTEEVGVARDGDEPMSERFWITRLSEEKHVPEEAKNGVLIELNYSCWVL